MKDSITLLRNRPSLLEALSIEASAPSRNLKHYSYYQFPRHIQLGLFDRKTHQQADPVVALIYAHIRTNMAALANHLKFGKTGITLGDLCEMLRIEMDFDALHIANEEDPAILNSVFEHFGIAMPPNCDIVRVTDNNFFIGDWWYGISGDTAFLCRHIEYAK